MTPWMTMFKKDIRILSAGRPWVFAVLLVIVAGIGTASYLKVLPPGAASAAGGILMVSNLFILPAGLFKGLNKEMKRTPSLWLQTPESGWSMLASKVLSSLLWTIVFFVITYWLALLLFRIDLPNVLASIQENVQTTLSGGNFSWDVNSTVKLTSQQLHINELIGLIPRIELCASVGLVACGFYIAMWASAALMVVHATRQWLHKFSWLAGLAMVLAATWGLGAVESTPLYQHAFGWGHVPILSLLAPNMQSLLLQSVQSVGSVTIGYAVFYLLIMTVLFCLTGWLIDRHVEV